MVRQEIGIRKKKDKTTEDADMGFGDWVNVLEKLEQLSMYNLLL